MIQVDAAVTVQCIVIGDVAVIHATAKINPRLCVACRPGRSETGDIHMIRGHVEDVFCRRCRLHRHHACTVTLKRERLVHEYIL